MENAFPLNLTEFMHTFPVKAEFSISYKIVYTHIF